MTHLELLKSKIVSKEDLILMRYGWKFFGKKVVMTNGCFDFLHMGHVEYLSKTADLGNIIIVALNTDDSVRRLKGPGRPINKQEDRAMALAALSFVSFIVYFDEDTPEDIITALLPDILTKGADYSLDDIVGAKAVLANGGEVERIPLTDGFSTTDFIAKMQKTN